MRLYNFNTKQIEDISDDEVEGKLYEGNYGFLNDDTVTLDGPEGVKDYKGSEAAKLFGDGEYLFRPTQDRITDQDRNELTKQRAIAFGEGAIRGVGTELVAGGLHKLYGQEGDLYEQRKETPEATAGEVIGQVGSFLIPTSKLGKVGKTVTKLLPSRLIDDSGELLVKKFGPSLSKYIGITETSSIAGKALKAGAATATRAATFGGGFTTADVIADYVYTNKNLTMEDSSARIAKSFITNGTFGFLFGAGSSAAYNTTKKVFDKAFDSVYKASKQVVKESSRKTILPEISDVRMSKDYFDPSIGTTSAHFKEIPEENVYRYKDGQKTIELNKSKIDKEITNIDDVESVNLLGSKMKMLGLGYVVGEEISQGNTSTVLNKAANFYSNTPTKQLFNSIERIKTAKKHIFKRIRAVYAERDNLLRIINSEEPISPSIVRRIEAIKNDIDLFKNTLNGMNKGKNKLATVKNSLRMFKNTDLEIKRFSKITRGYKQGDSLYIFDKELMEESLENGWLNSFSKPGKGISKKSQKFLNWLNPSKKDLRLNPDRLEEASAYIEHNSVGKKGVERFTPSHSRLDDSLRYDKDLALAEMDSALVQAGNLMEQKQIGPSVTGVDIADWIRDNWITRYKGKNGQIRPMFESKVGKLEKLAKKWENFTDEMTVHDLIKERRAIDSEVGEWFPSQTSQFKKNKFADEFSRSFRGFLEDSIMYDMQKLTDGEEILSHYITAKKLFTTVSDVDTILQKAVESASRKKGLDIPDFQKTVALSLGGGITSYLLMGNPILGAVVASSVPAARWARNNFGEFWIGMFYDKLAKRTANFEKIIDNSVNKFIKTPLSGPITVGIRFGADWTAKEAWEKEKKSIENRSANIEGMAEKFQDDNTISFDLYPDLLNSIVSQANSAIKFLEEIFPNSPYPENSGISWEPSADSMFSYERAKKAVINPNSILDGLSMGYISDEEIKVLKNLYPSMLENIKNKFIKRLGNKKLSYQQRVLVKRLFGFSGENTLRKMPIIQQNQEQQQQPRQVNQQSGKIRKSSGKFSGQEPTESLRIENK